MRHEKSKETSSVTMTMVQSTGQWLNGSMTPQHHFVSQTYKDPDGKTVLTAYFSFEQITKMLMYNGEVECTLSKYRGLDGKYLEEKVDKPKTIHSRMKERLGESRKELKSRIDDLYKDIYEAVNSKTAGKKKLEELLHQADTIKRCFGSNDDFVMEQTEEELTTMQSEVICQLGVFLQSQHGIETTPELLQKMLPISEDNLLEDKSEKSQPVVTGYKKKIRKEKNLEDMTSMEVADAIHIYLKKFEREAKEGELYYASASCKGNKIVEIKYVSYQGTHSLSLDDARTYLTFLKSATQFKHHYNLLK